MPALAERPLTEDALVAAIAAAIGRPPRKLQLGIGDDAAAWKVSSHHLSLITTDMLVDGVHFRLTATPPASLGHKSLAVSLSDIAAMGGIPTVAVIALGVTAHMNLPWTTEFYAGLSGLARSAGCAIAGGDIVRSPIATIAVTVCGEVRRSRLKTRCDAKAGDLAVISGPLGFAAAGLRLPGSEKDEAYPELVAGAAKSATSEVAMTPAQRAARAYQRPVPRLSEGKFFSGCASVHALMDVSDGLSSDLQRMARSSAVDAVIRADVLKPEPALEQLAALLELDAWQLMLHGGDDYELLAAVDRRAFPHVSRGFKHRFGRNLTVAGEFQPGAGLLWLDKGGDRTPLAPAGYDHLKPARHLS